MKTKLATLLLLLFATSLIAVEPYETLWNGILSRYTRVDTKHNIQTRLVDYAALKQDALFPFILQGLESENPDLMKTDTEKEAFWINAYNIAAIKLALDAYPLSSVLDRGTFIFRHAFDVQVLTVNHKLYTLREIENKVIKFKDPNSKYALCVASLSAPDLAKEGYTHVKLSRQLAAAKAAYENNPTKGEKLRYDWRLNDTSDYKK